MRPVRQARRAACQNRPGPTHQAACPAAMQGRTETQTQAVSHGDRRARRYDGRTAVALAPASDPHRARDHEPVQAGLARAAPTPTPGCRRCRGARPSRCRRSHQAKLTPGFCTSPGAWPSPTGEGLAFSRQPCYTAFTPPTGCRDLQRRDAAPRPSQTRSLAHGRAQTRRRLGGAGLTPHGRPAAPRRGR